MLENTCFAFSKSRLNHAVQQKGWTCPEAADLSRWARFILAHQSRLQDRAILEADRPLNKIIDSVCQISFALVRRLHITVDRLEQFISDAVRFAILLQDQKYIRKLTELRNEAFSIIDELRHNKDLLEAKLRKTMKQLARQNGAIALAEAVAVNTMLAKDIQYQKLAEEDIAIATLSSELDVVTQDTGMGLTTTTIDSDLDLSSELARIQEEARREEAEFMIGM